ncbi:hypothetical protein ACI65C_008687 [Semiaphis heraclei]
MLSCHLEEDLWAIRVTQVNLNSRSNDIDHTTHNKKKKGLGPKIFKVHGNGKMDSDGNYDSEDSNCSSGGSIRVTDSCTTATPSIVSPVDHHHGAQTPSVLHPTALPLPTPPTSDWYMNTGPGAPSIQPSSVDHGHHYLTDLNHHHHHHHPHHHTSLMAHHHHGTAAY